MCGSAMKAVLCLLHRFFIPAREVLRRSSDRGLCRVRTRLGNALTLLNLRCIRLRLRLGCSGISGIASLSTGLLIIFTSLRLWRQCTSVSMIKAFPVTAGLTISIVSFSIIPTPDSSYAINFSSYFPDRPSSNRYKFSS